MARFVTGEQAWISKLGNLRNTIRQELIGRQLAQHIGQRRTVLDVGCGQGTQSLRLLQSGCSVTGIEPSSTLAERFAADAAELGCDPEILTGSLDDLDALLGDRVFDVVCAHGLLMYLDDPAAALVALCARVADGGVLSFTFKNAHGLAMRPALRGDWALAHESFDSDRYVNELGVIARANRLDDVEAWVEAGGLMVADWYGVRVFNDAVSGEILPPPDDLLREIIDAEDRAGSTDPYRWLGSQLHVIAHHQR